MKGGAVRRGAESGFLSVMMNQNTKLLIAAFFFLIVLILTYSNHFSNAFHFDDCHTIVDNDYIRDIKNIPLFFKDATTFSTLPPNQSYRPIVTTLNAIDYWIGGKLDPFYFHLSIFFWYVVQCILLFFLFRNILNLSFPHKLNPMIALFATAWYSLHTSNAETINYIISRADSFSTLCIVASLLLYQNPRARKYYLYLLTMIIGIYTKQTGLMFVPLLFLYILFFEEKVSSNDLIRFKNRKRITNTFVKSAPAIVLGTSLFLVNQFYLTPGTTVSSDTTVSRLHYFMTQFYVITHYIGNFFLPVNLSADPDFTIITSIGDPGILFGLFVVVLLVALAIISFRSIKTRPISYGIFWFFIALAPTSSFIPLFQVGNDHRTFFPYVGLVLSVSWFIGLVLMKYDWAVRRSSILRLAVPLSATFIILVYAEGTYRRNKVWSSGESLWYDVTIKSPKNGRGLLNYGITQMGKGRYDIALQYFDEALTRVPRNSYLHTNLGILKDAMGKPEEAERHFRDGLRYGRYNPDAYYYYARWLYNRNRREESGPLLEEGFQLSPGHAKMRHLLDIVTVQEKRVIENRIDSLLNGTSEKALELSPDFERAENNLKLAQEQESKSK